MAKMFTDAELKRVISGFLQRDGYFVTCYKEQRRIGEIVNISATAGIGKCRIERVSTRMEALKQIADSGLNPADFSLEYLWFYRAVPYKGGLESMDDQMRNYSRVMPTLQR
jgi:hypothetical protein